jgi:hypothetical protein
MRLALAALVTCFLVALAQAQAQGTSAVGDASTWLWGFLAGLALLAAAIWFFTSRME